MNTEFYCHVCHRLFKSCNALSSHSKTHTNGYEKCNICNKIYRYKESLKKHMFNTHDITDDVHKYRCVFCVYSAINVYNLNLYVRKRHPMSGEINVTCPDCGLACRNVISLLKHYILGHPIQNVYKCTKCDASFNSRLVINMHMKFHDDDI